MTVVNVKKIGFAVFDNPAFGCQLIVLLILRTDGKLAFDFEQRQPGGANRRCPIIGHIQIKKAIPIDVGQRHGGGRTFPIQTAR